MKKILWKLFITASISAAVFFVVRQTVLACASSGQEEDSDFYSVFSPETMGPTRLSPFFYTISDTYFKASEDSLIPADSSATEHSNIAEWKTYLNNVPGEEDLGFLINKTTLQDLETLRDAVSGKEVTVRDSLKNNTAFAFIRRKKDMAAASYLVFAKRCEPQATAGANEERWGELPVRDTMLMQNLVNEGQKAREGCRSEFIRLRYAYQVVRMAHYSGQYELCLKLYKEMMEGRSLNTTIGIRGMALKGGALTRLKRGGEAAYIFAMLFDKYFNYDWELYRQNFDWAHGDGVPFCKSDHERVVVKALQAFSMRENLPLMIDIMNLEPGSEYLDVLLTRQIKWIEHDMLPDKFAYERKVFVPEKEKISVPDLQETRDFVISALKQGKLKRPFLWNFTAGYLSYLLKDVPSTKLYFAAALSEQPGNTRMRDQMQVISVLQKVNTATQLDKGYENALYGDVCKLYSGGAIRHVPDARYLLFYQLSMRYLLQGDTVHYLLCAAQTPVVPDLHSNPRAFNPDKLITFLSRRDHNPLEKMLCDTFMHTYPVTALHELKGTVFLQDHRFMEAAEEFRKSDLTDTLPADPFLIHTTDCHDCDFEASGGKRYTRLDLTLAMMQLEKQSNTLAGEEGARAAFEAGNGYYNMTYYGNTWMALAWYRSGYDTLNQYYDCSVAQYFYHKAKTLSKDREFQARCVMMEAKCVQNAWYRTQEWFFTATACLPGNPNYLSCYKELKEKYADTRYYREIIAECSYLRCYTSHNH